MNRISLQKQVTLGHIEHEILRKTFDDPRIHFAIVCASTSCPALRAEAYRFDILERQLHEQTIAFKTDLPAVLTALRSKVLNGLPNKRH
jgi:hypothetical protein